MASCLDLMLCEWVLELLPPERLPELAVRALEHGGDAPTWAVLASLKQPARADVEDLLPALLRELGVARPTELQAMKVLVDDTARKICAGELHPVAGAELIWGLWGYSREPAEHAPMWPDMRPFIGLARDCELAGSDAAEYERDIIREAEQLLQRGGLHI